MTTPRPPNAKPRWYHPTPDRLLVALLPAVGFLWLSERFCWFAFNEHKNWTVLIAAAVVCAGMVFLLLWCGASLVFRRRFQFGIRSLLVLVTVVAVVCSWFSVKVEQAERQREVFEAVVKGGGFVNYRSLYNAGAPEPPGPAWLRSLVGVEFLADPQQVKYSAATDNGLLHLKGLTSLELLWLDSTQVTDAGLIHLKGLTSLQWLSLNNTQVTDAGLMHLKGLVNLQRLPLANTQVTDAGLTHLEGLTSLVWLDLSGTPVAGTGLVHLKGMTRLQSLLLANTQATDAGLAHLVVLPDLLHLDLSNTQVTDAGLVHLEGMTIRYFLSLDNTQVTDEGVERLQQALPDCEITY